MTLSDTYLLLDSKKFFDTGREQNPIHLDGAGSLSSRNVAVKKSFNESVICAKTVAIQLALLLEE